MIGCGVQFGDDLLRPELDAMVSKFRSLAFETLDSPLYVDTVFAIDRAREERIPFSEPFWCVLLDIHRLFLFQASGKPSDVSMRSIARFVMDDHRFRGDQMLTDAMKGLGYRFLFTPESLDVLPLVWRSDTTQTIIMDFSTGEISRAEAQEYPPRPAPYSGNPIEVLSIPPLDLDDCGAGPNWRIASQCRIEGLMSSYTGIIRSEHVRFTATSIPCATTRVLFGRGKEESLCGGLSIRAGEALAIGRCEAMERFQVAFIRETERLVCARYADLPDAAVDPRTLFFPARPGGTDAVDDAPMYWTAATRIARAEQALVPAQEVWFGTERLPRETLRIRPTTNGCAAGNSVTEASLFAILELVERDAYLVMWYLRCARGKLNLDSLQSEPVQLLLARLRYKFPEYRVHVFDIGTDVPIPVVAAIAVRERGTGPKTLHAAAARPRVEQAAFSALKDLALSFDMAAEENYRRPDWKPPELEEMVASPDDHRAFYASDDRFSRLSFLDFESPGDRAPQDIDRASVFNRLDGMKVRSAVLEVAGTLESLGLPVFLKNITHAFSAKRGLFCVKAIVPGLFPMWYGRRHIRFSLTDRLRRLAIERTGRVVAEESDINLQVHPFG